MLIAYFTIRLLKSDDPRWWLAIGAAVGLGLVTKYAIVFYIAGILAGLVSHPARRFFSSRWFWAGIALALLIFLPNFIWLARHDFISYHFLQHIHARDVGEGRANGFLQRPVPRLRQPCRRAALDRRPRRLPAQPPLSHAGLHVSGPACALLLGKGRDYYMAGAYPMLLAMGAVLAERWLVPCPVGAGSTIESVYFAAFAFVSAYVCAVVLPLASSGPLQQFRPQP